MSKIEPEYGFVESLLMEQITREDDLRAISESFELAEIINKTYKDYDETNGIAYY